MIAGQSFESSTPCQRSVNPSTWLQLPVLNASVSVVCARKGVVLEHLLTFTLWFFIGSVSLTPAIQQIINNGAPESASPSNGVCEEKKAYLLLLISLFAASKGAFQAAMEASTMAILSLQAVPAGQHLRSFDPLLARHYYFLARSYELTGTLPSLHHFLMTGLRTAVLNHDIETEATIYNCILRLHLTAGDFDSSSTFLNRSSFPAGAAFNSQLARFHFYRAQVRAHCQDYAGAADDLNQALRKAPTGLASRNFVLLATKFSIVVTLLRGSIPERSIFSLHPRALQPYLQLTQAVRLGDLARFNEVLSSFAACWARDGTADLVPHLHGSVLRVGLGRLAHSYLRISFADIRSKLGLNMEAEAKTLVIEALRQGIIEGHVNEVDNCFESKPAADLYSTQVPQETFNARSRTLRALHNDAVRAMRFSSAQVAKASAEESEEHRPTEAELMEEFMDADEDMF